MIAVALIAVLRDRWMDFRYRAHFHHQELSKILVSELECFLACTQAQGEMPDRSERQDPRYGRLSAVGLAQR
jgi:hypothetical protein